VEGREGGVVDMAEEKDVNGTVPISGELVPGDAVPPVGIEFSIGEVCDFG